VQCLLWLSPRWGRGRGVERVDVQRLHGPAHQANIDDRLLGLELFRGAAPVTGFSAANQSICRC
jgi:hypothetical protein